MLITKRYFKKSMGFIIAVIMIRERKEVSGRTPRRSRRGRSKLS